METIFVKVLKKLISEQLTPLSASQQSKSESYGYNNALSLVQQTLVNQLLQAIARYSKDVTDDESVKEVTALITKTREEVQKARERFDEDKNDGEAVKTLTNLEQHIKEFYTKIADRNKDKPEIYAYKVLDVAFKNNPLHLMYELDLHYTGTQIFDPKKVDGKTRAAKELKVGERVKILSEQIQETHGLEEQRSRTNKTLDDLKRDNEDIIRQESNMFSTVLSKFSFYGVSPNVQTTGEGRLGRFIESTLVLIETMTLSTFESLAASDESPPSDKKRSGPKSEPKEVKKDAKKDDSEDAEAKKSVKKSSSEDSNGMDKKGKRDEDDEYDEDHDHEESRKLSVSV